MTKPPYQITSLTLNLLSSIHEKIGEINAKHLIRSNPTLRKRNQIKTIHSSLRIEGNTLSEDQITALLEDKLVVGPKKDIIEVQNALEVYQNLAAMTYKKESDFLKAHQLLLKGLVAQPGSYRNRSVGIVKGKDITHLAPPHDRVAFLMKDLFRYVNDKSENILIKSCVFHYELEFIHPFIDGNGRMGRLWQTLILIEGYPLFEYIPFETLIAKDQKAYYAALSLSDKLGESTKFIEYMLGIIDSALSGLVEKSVRKMSEEERITVFLQNAASSFSRKDYIHYFKDISTATASRDLKKAVQLMHIAKTGDKKMTIYEKI